MPIIIRKRQYPSVKPTPPRIGRFASIISEKFGIEILHFVTIDPNIIQNGYNTILKKQVIIHHKAINYSKKYNPLTRLYYYFQNN